MANLDPRLAAQLEKDGVGSFLRRVREAKDITLRSVSEHTRIRTYYLESIDNSEFHNLPTGPVGLGFVRAYADAVGVDNQAVVASYKREISGGVQLEGYELEPAVRTFATHPRRMNRFSSVATFAFVLVFLLAGGGLLWYMKGKTEQLVPIESIINRVKKAIMLKGDDIPRQNQTNASRNNEAGAVRKKNATGQKAPEATPTASNGNMKEPPATKKEEKPQVQAAVANTPAQESPQTEEAPPAPENTASVEATPAPQNPSAPASGQAAPNAAPDNQAAPKKPRSTTASQELPLILKIFATEDTWLRIVVDSKNTEELLLLAGNERNWKGSEKFALTVGNVAGTQISLNGSEVALPRNSSNVLRDFIITKKSLN